jgi:outer membrane protein TolC
MTQKLIIILFLLLTSMGFSQENNYSFTLDEAIRFALENNYTALNAARDIDAAQKQKWETTANGLPQINAKIEYQNFLKQAVSLLPAAAFDPLSGLRDIEEYYNLDAQQIQELPAAPEGFIPVTFGTKQNVNASVTLSQLIFDGSYLVALQASKVFTEYSQNLKDKTDLEVRKAVVNAYGNVLLSQESVAILEKNVANLKKNVFETTETFKNGLTEEENVEQLQITLSNLESSLKNTIRLARISKQLLNLTLGIEINSQVNLSDDLNGLALLHMQPQLLGSDLNLALNTDFKIAKNFSEQRRLELKNEQAKALPTLSGFLNAGYAGNSNDFSFFRNEQQWFGSSLVGVNLSIPIFSSFGRAAKTARAKIAFSQAETQLTETKQRIKLETETAKSNYSFAIDQYETSKRNLNLAERIEKKNQTKFIEGIASSFELRQAQIQLYGAQQEYLQAMLDVINQKANLEAILNTISN